MRATLIAGEPQGAAGDATETNVVWKFDRGVPTTPSILVAGEEVYFVSDNGVATCLDAHTGQVRWTERLRGGFFGAAGLADGRRPSMTPRSPCGPNRTSGGWASSSVPTARSETDAHGRGSRARRGSAPGRRSSVRPCRFRPRARGPRCSPGR